MSELAQIVQLPETVGRFVITGLPRMRSAWFSAYLSQGDVHCFHEGIFFDEKLTGFPYAGTADGGGYLIRPEWVDSIGDHQLVVIHRDPEDVARSLADINIPKGLDLELMAEQLEHLGGLHVDFSDIDERLKEIHEYLKLPGYSKRRADLFIGLNIQAREWSR